MAAGNFVFSDDTYDKLRWLADVNDDSQAGVVRKLIDQEWRRRKTEYETDKDFIRWTRSNRES
jgi:hypothetical protein